MKCLKTDSQSVSQNSSWSQVVHTPKELTKACLLKDYLQRTIYKGLGRVKGSPGLEQSVTTSGPESVMGECFSDPRENCSCMKAHAMGPTASCKAI